MLLATNAQTTHIDKQKNKKMKQNTHNRQIRRKTHQISICMIDSVFGKANFLLSIRVDPCSGFRSKKVQHQQYHQQNQSNHTDTCCYGLQSFHIIWYGFCIEHFFLLILCVLTWWFDFNFWHSTFAFCYAAAAAALCVCLYHMNKWLGVNVVVDAVLPPALCDLHV